MSYMRALELGLSGQGSADIEKSIPFWEFLDIEYDNNSRQFRFTSHYTQEPSFPSLFRRLITSTPIKKIDDEIHGKQKLRIYKQDWMPRSELEYQVGAMNVIYMLSDTEKKHFYVGEAKDLVKRLSSGHPIIKGWDYFRYDTLPDELESSRVVLERMVIRDLACIMKNNRNIPTLTLSDGCSLRVRRRGSLCT